MAIKLIDRKESVSYKGSTYELTLLWDRESIRKCFCGMPPFFAHIRKDGVNFATIDCYSNNNGRFVVKKFIPNRSLETELALFLMTAIRKMWLYIVGS